MSSNRPSRVRKPNGRYGSGIPTDPEPIPVDEDSQSDNDEKEDDVNEINRRELNNCPVSQARQMFIARQNNSPFSMSDRCEMCGRLNGVHPMQSPDDPESMLQSVFHPVIQIPKPVTAEIKAKESASDEYTQKEFQISKMIQTLSEHHSIKESWNPNQMLPQLFLRKYETHMYQLAANMPLVWIRLLPSTLHSSIRTEFEWVNQNICQLEGVDWNTAKSLFIDHWQRSDSGLLLLEQYNSSKQGEHQNVNEFINAFHQQLDLYGIKEDSRVCDEFLLKLNPWIRRQVLLQLKFRDPNEPRTLKKIEEAARTIEATSTRPPMKSDGDKQRFKRKGTYPIQSNGYPFKTPKPDDHKVQHCANHPHTTNHSTQDCRLNQKRTKQESEGIKPITSKVLDDSATKRVRFNIEPFNKDTAKTPYDDNWVCVICNQKKPGHYPPDCPQKKSK
jgi:hypothetical protein